MEAMNLTILPSYKGSQGQCALTHTLVQGLYRACLNFIPCLYNAHDKFVDELLALAGGSVIGVTISSASFLSRTATKPTSDGQKPVSL